MGKYSGANSPKNSENHPYSLVGFFIIVESIYWEV